MRGYKERDVLSAKLETKRGVRPYTPHFSCRPSYIYSIPCASTGELFIGHDYSGCRVANAGLITSTQTPSRQIQFALKLIG
jgi:hypothetical protein